MACTLRLTIAALVLLGICHLSRPVAAYQRCSRYWYSWLPYDIERDRYDDGYRKCCYCRNAWTPWQCREDEQFERMRCGSRYYTLCCYTDDDNGNGNGNGNGYGNGNGNGNGNNYLKYLFGGNGNGNGEYWEEYIDERYDK
uniref:N14 matrix protein n=1 Tax=Pinctada maxima TaxID=104660 RepID=MA14_PINMA|nr:RecName: Full=N14 matrix protein; Flags: Precursor [Pinctada maxima]BAA90539.1 N14 matrix protein [Pinctada maxima]